MRLALACCTLLAAACGPGPAGTTDAATTDASTSSGPTTAAPTSTEPPTGTTTGTSTDVGTDATTGGSTCDAIVGSRDCAALVAASGELTLEQCEQCQGAACGAIADCDAQYPCVDGAIVLQGCCEDEQCAELSPYCGRFTGTNSVCVLHDDV